MPKLDFNILDISQIDSPYTLEIFKKGCVAKQTDLVTLLGGDGSYNAYNGDSPSNIVLFDGTIHHYCREEKMIGIRPIVPFQKISDGIISKHINEDGILEVEYGYYPQNILVSEEAEQVQWINNTLYAKYTSNSYKPNDMNSLSEHEYNGNRYIIFYTLFSKRESYPEKLSDGSKVDPEKTYFIKVEPIKWLVDKKSGLAISKYILSYTEIYNTKKFLIKFSHDITQIKPPSHIDVSGIFVINQKTDEVSKIVSEINKYAEFYHGKIDIALRVNDLIVEYNAKLNNALTGGSILTLETSDKDMLYMKLLADLNITLDGLKRNYENNKVYHDILSLINRCLSLINKRTTLLDSGLEQDIKTLIDIIIPYLNNNDYLNRLKAIFEEQKQAITTSLESMENLSSKINGNYKTVNEFELSIRKALHPLLKKIYLDVANKNTIDEIVRDYKSILDNNYQESKYNIAKTYITAIDELSNYIKANGSEEDISKMNQALITIGDNENLTSITNYLIKIIQQLYLITLSIDERKEKQRELAEYTINLGNIKMKKLSN